MNDKQQRADFEMIIGTFPYERSIERQPNDPSMAAFPGQYKDIDVQVAWELYQKGYEHGRKDLYSKVNAMFNRKREED